MKGDIDRMKARVLRVAGGVTSFADEMRAAGIHVGMGNPGRCVNCGEMWPCPGSRAERDEHAPRRGGDEHVSE